jgi:hypothetical protein
MVIYIDLCFGEQEATLILRDRTQAVIYARENDWL